MSVTFSLARYREHLGGRDSMERASIWQGQAGTIWGLSQVYQDPGLAIATTTTAIKTTNSAQYLVGGGGYTKGATDNFWTLGGSTSSTVVPVSSYQKYILLVDDSGAASVQEGVASTVGASSVAWTNVTPQAKAFPQNPWAPLVALLYNTSRCIFGIATVATDSSHTFTPGTTALNATGITTTFRWSIDPTLLPLLASSATLIVGRDI